MPDKKVNYNWEALRGLGVDDMEYVNELGLDPSLAYTPKLIDAMIDLTYKQNIENGTSVEKAKELRKEAERYQRELLAMNGLLNKK